MRPEMEALRSALAGISTRPAFLVLAPSGQAAPYYLIEPAWAARPYDAPLTGDLSAWSATVRIKAVGMTPEQAMTHQAAARDALCPDGRRGYLTAPGRSVVVLFERHEADYVDLDVTPPKFLSVDTVRIESVPA